MLRRRNIKYNNTGMLASQSSEELLGCGKTRCVFKAGIHFVIGAIQEHIIRVTRFNSVALTLALSDRGNGLKRWKKI